MTLDLSKRYSAAEEKAGPLALVVPTAKQERQATHSIQTRLLVSARKAKHRCWDSPPPRCSGKASEDGQGSRDTLIGRRPW